MKGDKTVSSAVSVRSLGMFREIATNVRHGLRRKGFLTIQTLNQNESSIVMGNGVKVPVVATGTFRLFLDTDCYLDLFQTLYVPSISRNLVSISKLDLEVDALEVYIVEVERQLDKKVKIIRSDRGGEYYGRNDGLGQCPGPFAKLLEKHESDYDIGTSKDPVSFSQAISCSDSNKWIDAMNDELKSMDQNKRLVVNGSLRPNATQKAISNRHKADLWPKVSLERGIDYKKTFSPVSKKDSLRIIMALVAHFDLELHQMDVKPLFLMGMERIPYASAVGSLMYAQTCTRPDISFAVGMLGRYQRLAIVDTIEKPLKIYCDNSAAVFFSKNDKYSNGAKHMELKYFAVKEEVQKQRVSIEHINTELMVADPLTKGLPPKTFKEHVKRMGLDCNP
ncbi:hypothetical protein AAG906_008108 [Vitis piasezkii]